VLSFPAIYFSPEKPLKKGIEGNAPRRGDDFQLSMDLVVIADRQRWQWQHLLSKIEKAIIATIDSLTTT
jgi:hypothetical protein